MPCKDGEKAMNARDEQPPCTPLRPTGNRGAGLSELVDSDEESNENLQEGKKKRRWNGRGRREFTHLLRDGLPVRKPKWIQKISSWIIRTCTVARD